MGSFKLDTFFKSFSDTEDQLDFRFANETVGQKMDTVSTGSLVLNDALGCGGLAAGRIHQYYGKPGAGKSLMSILAIKEAQRKDPKAQQLFIDAEQTFSPQWCEELGVDTGKVIVIDGDTATNGRRLFTILLGEPKEDAKTHALKGKSKEGLLDKVTSKELNLNLIVLDSITAVLPPGEDVSAVGKQNISLLARFLTTTFRKLSPELAKSGVPMIVINHVRDSMDQYGPDHTYSGGNSYSHYLFSNCYFSSSRSKDNQILDEKGERRGAVILCNVEKTKGGPHPKKVNFKVDFTVGIVDQEEEVAELALKYGVVEKTSTVTHEYGDRKWTGFPKFCEAIKTEEGLQEELIKKIEETREAQLQAKRDEQTAKRAASGLISASDEDIGADETDANEEEVVDNKKKGRKAKA